jgi:hypothetical protein
MSITMGDQEAPIIEPRLVEDDFADGLLRIEPAGQGRCLRLVFYSNYEDASGARYRRIMRKVVVPINASPAMEDVFTGLLAHSPSVTLNTRELTELVATFFQRQTIDKSQMS